MSAKLGDLMGVPEAISRLGHPVAVPALASGALPVIAGHGAGRVRRCDVDALSAAPMPVRGHVLPALPDLRSRR